MTAKPCSSMRDRSKRTLAYAIIDSARTQAPTVWNEYNGLDNKSLRDSDVGSTFGCNVVHLAQTRNPLATKDGDHGASKLCGSVDSLS